MAFFEKSNVPQKCANYANYLIKYARYERSPELIGFYGKNYTRNNQGTFDTPRHQILIIYMYCAKNRFWINIKIRPIIHSRCQIQS